MSIKLIFSFILIGAASLARADLKVGATTTDIEALVKAIGQDRVTVFAIAKGTQDPHQLEAKPSYMVKLRDTQLLVAHGLDLESAWLGPLVKGSRNLKIVETSAGFLELAPSLKPIEVAGDKVSRAQGDVHPQGNPHFHLDPVRIGEAAEILAMRMGELDPGNKEFYTTNAATFKKRMLDKIKIWQARLNKTGIKEVVTYHKTFSYFLARFGLRGNLQLEPKPGIPPTPGHILEVIRQMQQREIRLVLIENFFDDSVKIKIKQSLPNVRVVTAPVYVGGEPAIATNEELIESLVSVIEGGKK